MAPKPGLKYVLEMLFLPASHAGLKRNSSMKKSQTLFKSNEIFLASGFCPNPRLPGLRSPQVNCTKIEVRVNSSVSVATFYSPAVEDATCH